jgi:hypothetical protein
MGPTVMLYIRFEAPISAVCQLLASGMENKNREKKIESAIGVEMSTT